MKLTPEGKQQIEANLNDLRVQLKNLEEEKAVAYNLTGDTWHDNPYFNALTQSERALNEKIREAEETLAKAEVVDSNSRSIETVEIGSIIRCICKYPSFSNEQVYEIAGHGETNLSNGKIAYDSPVGQNLMGHKSGDIVSFKTPAGNATYEIVRFYPDWDAAKNEK